MEIINGKIPNKRDCLTDVSMLDLIWECCLSCWAKNPAERPVISEMKNCLAVSIIEPILSRNACFASSGLILFLTIFSAIVYTRGVFDKTGV